MRMILVFSGQDYPICRDTPIDANLRIIPGECTFLLWSIKIIAFVLEYRFLTQYHKTMGKTARDKELAMVFFREFYRDVFPESRRSFPYIHSNIENLAFNDSDQLALRILPFLKMKTAEDSISTLALVILDKSDGANLLIEILLAPGFKEVSSVVTKHLGFDDDHSFNTCLYYVYHV